MRVRVKNTIKTSDGVVCFTAGKVYNVREDYFTDYDDRFNIHRKPTGLVSTIDDRGEPSVLMFSEFEVTYYEDRHPNYR